MKTLQFIVFLAWRNVLRYRKRTFQSFLVLLLGAFSVMLIDAYMKGYAALANERIVSLYGHLDVHATGYLDAAEAMPLDLSLPEVDNLADRLLATAEEKLPPSIRSLAAASIETACMLSNGDTSRGSLVIATNPWAYGPKVLYPQDRSDSTAIPRGSAPVPNPLLSEVEGSLVAGRFFARPDEAGAILDERYAKSLGLGPGDSVILLGSDAYGSFSLLESPILGLAREAGLPGGAGCVVDLASFGPSFGLEGGASTLSLWLASAEDGSLLDSAAEADTVAQLLGSLADEPGLEARPFHAIAGSYAALFDFLDMFMAGMMAVFIVVAAAAMTNAILLSIHDRVKDMGTLRAIALTGRQAGLLVYAETLIIGVAAALGAFVLGLAVVWVLIVSGADLSFEMSDLGTDFPNSIKPRLYPGRLFIIAAVSAAFPLLAAILPSRTLKRLGVRESLGY